ncbi:hypothetical protein ACWKSP_05710 [Micromonosporaceae bacterium Da 78-11]
MTSRRLTSRKVVLTAAFLALAAGGTAACDASYPDESDSFDAPTYTDQQNAGPGSGSGTSGSGTSDSDVAPVADDSSDDQVFYCADEEGQIVDEDFCEDDGDNSTYFLWYSPGYTRGLAPGTYLDGGDYIATNDRAARRSLKLPATGKISNGTVKTNVVGRGSTGSGSTLTGGSDSSGG